MSSDDKKLAESIRSGAYFKEARSWFQAMYIGPISERSFFLMVAVFAVLAASFSVMAAFSFLPIISKPGLLVYVGERNDEVETRLVGINREKKPLNSAMVDFFASQYVKARESYSVASYLLNANQVRHQSDEALYAAYIAQHDVSNPDSMAARMGEVGRRMVMVNAVNSDASSAVVTFTTVEAGTESENKTRWTAHIKFHYTGMDVNEQKNANTGKIELVTTDPKFQVVSYVVEQK